MKKTLRQLRFIPPWRGDETLYSWAAAFHVVAGNGSTRDTGSLLFGAAHACRDRLAPSGIDEFVRVTSGALGDTESILRGRCPLAQFIPFLPGGRFESMLRHRRDPAFAGWGIQLGMPASKLSSKTRLRSCRMCIADDTHNFGIPRWRLPHQLAGAWVCLEHNCMLAVDSTASSQWLLPHTGAHAGLQSAASSAEAAALQRLAGLSSIACRTDHLDVEALRQSVLARLRDGGVVGWSRKIQRSKLASWFVSKPLSNWLRTLQSPEASLCNGEWIHDLLGRRREDHPLKWLVLWTTVFDEEDQTASHRRFTDPWCAPCWDVNGQGNLWNPSTIDLPIDANRAVANATSLADLAQNMGVATQTLRRRVTTLGGSAGKFRQAQQRPEKTAHVIQSIRNFIDLNPGCTRSDVQRNCRAAVEWARLNSPEAYATATALLEDRTTRQQRLAFD